MALLAVVYKAEQQLQKRKRETQNKQKYKNLKRNRVSSKQNNKRGALTYTPGAIARRRMGKPLEEAKDELKVDKARWVNSTWMAQIEERQKLDARMSKKRTNFLLKDYAIIIGREGAQKMSTI